MKKIYNYRYVYYFVFGSGLDQDSVVSVYGTRIRIRNGKNGTQNEKEFRSVEQPDGFPTIESFMEIGNTSWRSKKKWYGTVRV
jgi:hypothetical protein